MKMNKKFSVEELIIIFLCLLIFLSIYDFLFLKKYLYGQDFQYKPTTNFKEFSYIPSIWSTNRFGGFNVVNTGFIFSDNLQFLTNLITYVTNLEYNIYIVRVFWFLPTFVFLLIGCFTLVRENKLPRSFIIIFFVFLICNSVLVSRIYRGQLGIVAAYSLIPLIYIQLFNFFNKKQNFNFELFASSLLIYVSLNYDFRVTILVVIFTCTYSFFILNLKLFLKKFAIIFVFNFLLNINYVIILYLNVSDILPSSFEQETINTATSSLTGGIFTILSFGIKFFNNENLLTFILLIILISPYLYKANFLKKKNYVIFILFLICIFLSKGNSPPFGGIYDFFFKEIKIMNMFRVPTKFYIFLPFLLLLLIIPIIKNYKNNNHIKYILILFLLSSNFTFYKLKYFEKFGEEDLKIGGRSMIDINQSDNELSEVKRFWKKIKEKNDFYYVLWLKDYFNYEFSDSSKPSLYLRTFFLNNKESKILTQAFDQFDIEKIVQMMKRYNINIIALKKKNIESNLQLKSLFNYLVKYSQEFKVFFEDQTIIALEIDSRFKNQIIDFIDKNKKKKFIEIDKISNTKYSIVIPENCDGGYIRFVSTYSNKWFLKKIQSKNILGLNYFKLSSNDCQQNAILEFKSQKIYQILFIYSMLTKIFILILILTLRKK